MDPELGVRAIDLIKLLSKGELDEIFKTYGEEKYSRSLADTLVRAREIDALQTTEDLAKVAEGVYRRFGDRDSRVHPATRMFQALRIVVNDELGAIIEALPQILERTQNYGRICIISFHSLEDRIIKNTFREWEKLGKGIVLTDKPLTSSEEELTKNPRSRSAKLRIFERN
jgi:16S rRNA (cytosine1402-N4)-methyltransferase